MKAALPALTQLPSFSPDPEEGVAARGSSEASHVPCRELLVVSWVCSGRLVWASPPQSSLASGWVFTAATWSHTEQMKGLGQQLALEKTPRPAQGLG
ncbi:hypothetical protein MC885_010058 [Smutsia gigantea]|nr:hypothetical protein MC885_010058 [Smutsia gigantea]